MTNPEITGLLGKVLDRPKRRGSGEKQDLFILIM